MRKSEQLEQIALNQYCTILERQNKIIFAFSVPNGGSRNVYEAKNLKREGLKSGVSDFIVVLKDRVLFIEMKRKPKMLKSGKLSYSGITISDNQKAFLDRLQLSQVCEGRVCYGFDQAKEFISENI